MVLWKFWTNIVDNHNEKLSITCLLHQRWKYWFLFMPIIASLIIWLLILSLFRSFNIAIISASVSFILCTSELILNWVKYEMIANKIDLYDELDRRYL